ncbi:hypothetical protein GP486_001717 [Trichoglossum hirsutum]|uniref:Plus3 domain-containing protein n=1 Tax=Trichoglossum hirsutum TaxID=265104 RepID=A0A9P8RSF6_9PEZI|nr:hypothetical protein GP486_001717 [Trichoglossum hirsutum]
MADIDADILALAGDESTGEETSNETPVVAKPESPPAAKPTSPASKRKRSTSPLPSIERVNIVQEPDGVTQADVKKRKKDDSPEDGEASSSSAPPSPHSSLRSAPMSESDSDSSSEDVDEDAPLFPIENKYKSETDKMEILTLPEIRREEILAERASLLEQEQQNRYLRQLLKDRAREEGKALERKKRKAAAADLEDENRRKSSRQKTILGGRKEGEASGALQEYKRQREQRGAHNEQRKRDEDAKGKPKKKGKRPDDDGYSDRDAEGDSEVEWASGKAAVPTIELSRPDAQGDQQPILKDFERCKVGSRNFAEVCFYPGFEEAIVGCFVRVCIGDDKQTRQNVYRLAQIKGFSKGRPYAMTGANKSNFVTDQYAVCSHGKATKDWPFIACSNGDITDAELERYRRVLEFESSPMPTKASLIRKTRDIDGLIRRSWTEEEIAKKLERSGAIYQRLLPLERKTIKNRREEAVRRGDEAEVAKCDAELAALEGPKLAFGTSLTQTPVRPKEKGQQDRLAEINRRNRKANAEAVRKAQIRERREDLKAQAAVARGEALPDSFKRVKTRAKVHYDANADALTPLKKDDLFGDGISDNSRAATPTLATSTSAAGTPQRSGTPVASLPGRRVAVGGIPTISRPPTDDDYLATMDFGIDIEL